MESFRGIRLVAGKSSLDNVISWPYPKHTKVVSPWVRGGEFILVSGYEHGVNDKELLELLSEAEMNHLSGILIEGGINFKELSPVVIDRADQLGVPLFFAPRVVSFLDICREISNVILESSLYDKYAASLLKKLVSEDSLSRKEAVLLFKEADVPCDEMYQVFLFSALVPPDRESTNSYDYNAVLHTVFNPLQHACQLALDALGVKPIVYLAASSVAYMVYGKSEADFEPILDAMKKLRMQFSSPGDNCGLALSSSTITPDIMGIDKAYQQALYTASLIRGGVIADNVYSFAELGSYQLPFFIEDKSRLLAFRDRYLGELHKNEQLLETLRAYLAFNGNMLRTAESLYIHRNTLSYRLERIEALIGRRLADAETVRDLLNALMVLDIYPY